MNDMFLRQQRAAQQQPDGSFPPMGMDEMLFRQQQLLRQQEQYQGQQQQQQQRSSNPIMQDFQFPSQGQQQQQMAGAGMPSLMEISRAEEILAAARDAITSNTSGNNRAAAGPSGNQFAAAGMPTEDYNASARSMLNQPDTRWATNYGGPAAMLRPPGAAQVNAPISSAGLGNQDLQFLLSKQNQGGFSLATANASQQSGMAMRQAMMNQMPAENMGVLESLLLRQEEERVKRQRGDDDDASSPRPRKYGFAGMEAGQQFPPEIMAGVNKNVMFQQGLEGVKPRKRRAKTFPVKLMETLMTHYDERYFAWLPDGRSFVIINPERFIEDIVCQTFKNSKYASFVRKLNRWGFARLTSGSGTDCFYHPLFQRDRLDLAAQMLCMPRTDSVSAKKRAEKGIAPAPAPVYTAASVDPKDRPSLVGVEKFFSEKGEQGADQGSASSPKGSPGATESESEDDKQHTSSPSDDRKQAAASSSPEDAGDKPVEL
jgi:hypothetical protein